MGIVGDLQAARERKEAAPDTLAALDDAARGLRKMGMRLQAQEVDILAGLVTDKSDALDATIERLQKLANREWQEVLDAQNAEYERGQ